MFSCLNLHDFRANKNNFFSYSDLLKTRLHSVRRCQHFSFLRVEFTFIYTANLVTHILYKHWINMLTFFNWVCRNLQWWTLVRLFTEVEIPQVVFEFLLLPIRLLHHNSEGNIVLYTQPYLFDNFSYFKDSGQ